MISNCKCAHAGQDSLHGQGRRVWNEAPQKDGSSILRCTVCGSEKQIFGTHKKKHESETTGG